MRILILIALLCNMAFSALYLNGATYTQVVTINHLSVSETNGHFLYQRKIPRTGNVILSVDSANDVGITRINDTTRIPRWVIFTTDTIFLYADIAVSSTADTSYRIQYGKALNEVNSSSTFTNCGITNFWGMDNTSTPISNYAGGPTLTASGSWSSNTGMFDVAVLSTVSTDMLTSDISIFANKTAFTYTILFRPGTIAGDNIFFSYRTSAGNIGFQIYYNPSIMNVYIGGVGNYGQIANPLTSNTPCLISVTYDGSQSTNATRLKLFINNEQKTFVGFNGTIPASIPSISGAETGNGISGVSTASPVGLIDDQCVAGAATTLGCITDRYNMLFNPSAFSTLGTAEYVSVVPNPHIDTLKLVCSAENALTYQWYDNNVAVSGATDSVYTIYADSTFYSIKHVIYCLVNGSVKSGEWKFQQSTTGSRWDSYKAAFKSAYRKAFK